MVYAHQHNVVSNTGKAYNISKNIPQQTVKEKCYLCDVMHHHVMVTISQVYFNPVVVASHIFKKTEYNFTSIQLTLSGGRAPPFPGYKS